MSTIATTLMTAFAVMVILAPRVLDTWLARRDVVGASDEGSMLERVAGGAE